MIQNWKYFIGAAFLGGALALRFGAPLLAILAGVLFAALVLAERTRRRTRRVPR